jgi:murein DD-endopeptidase MepM/ murein hydrolase activator NlpD
MKKLCTSLGLAAAIATSIHAASLGTGPDTSLLAPKRIIMPCQGPRGATVEFSVALRNPHDTNTTVECRPPSGSIFPVGTNIVTCITRDAAGSEISTAFPVIVAGGCAADGCIDLNVPEEIDVDRDSIAGAKVEFDVTGWDGCSGNPVAVTCIPPSGSIFAVGATRVICTASSGDKQTSAGFLVEVTDRTAPEIHCPTNMIVEAAQSPLGAVVHYEVPATDDHARQLRVRCSPPSGSAFPVGETRVFCQAGDGNGNVSSCSFIVKIEPAQPLRITRLEGGQVELRWTGDAVLEGTEALDEDAQWQQIPGVPQVDGVERVVHVPAFASQHFFRTRPLPLLPPADRDEDGVPDSRDHCPDTPTGLKVDEHGCSALELVATPEAVFGPERETLAKALSEIQLVGGFSNLAARLQTQLAPSNNPAIYLRSRELAGALQAQSNLVSELRWAVLEFPREMAIRIAELERDAPPLDPAHADVRPEDFEIERLRDIQAGLGDSLRQSEQTLVTLSNLVQAASMALPPERVRIASFDNEYGTAQLEDGRRLLLPKIESEGAPPINQIPGIFGTGEFVTLEASQLPDGTLFGLDMQQLEAIPNPGLKLDPTCLRLRFVPADLTSLVIPFVTPPAIAFGQRHHPRGYKWGYVDATSVHYLEFGMALAVEKVNSFAAATNEYRHWLDIRHDHNHDGSYSTLDSFMDEESSTYILTSNRFPRATIFPVVVREYRRRVSPSGPTELLKEETYLIEINEWGYYAQAEYSRTIFNLEDWPNEKGFEVAYVADINRQFPLMLQPLAQQTFTAQGFKPSGQTSSYPNLHDIHLYQSFAVHVQDPNYQLLFAHPDDRRRALRGPTISGLNKGRPFSYRVQLPTLLRDRLHDCIGGGPDSYYRIPFLGPYGAGKYGKWEVTQGNFGDSTHKGGKAYAFDFPSPEGRLVYASRGGIVIKTNGTSFGSCCSGCQPWEESNRVHIRHQDGTLGVYRHFKHNGVLVVEGQRVYRGDAIGKVGATGCATGPHLHFDVRSADNGSLTIPIRFECYDEDGYFRACYLPPHDSEGASTNKPYWWPF